MSRDDALPDDSSSSVLATRLRVVSLHLQLSTNGRPDMLRHVQHATHGADMESPPDRTTQHPARHRTRSQADPRCLRALRRVLTTTADVSEWQCRRQCWSITPLLPQPEPSACARSARAWRDVRYVNLSIATLNGVMTNLWSMTAI